MPDPLSNDDILIAHLDFTPELNAGEIWMLGVLDFADRINFQLRITNTEPNPEGDNK